MEDIIKICALGGLDERGRDLYVIEINDDIFVLEAGESCPDKSIPGVDYILPNADYLIQNKNRIKAYILTHGHDENMASLKYFYSLAPAPVYCTRATKYCFDVQAKIHGINIKVDFKDIPGSCEMDISGRKVYFFSVAHNAANSVGVAIDTTRGLIVYTGDFIVDYSLKYPEYVFDFQALSRLSSRGTFLLMSESKRAQQPGYCSPKHRIQPIVEKYFKDSKKRIFINSFWQNLFRISEIVSLVKQYHKKLYFYNDYTKTIMEKIFFKFSTVQLNPEDIVSKENLLRVKSEDLVVLMLGHGDELYEEMKLLTLGTNDDKRLSLTKNDLFINCALPLPSQETLATRSIDFLYRSGCEVVWVKSKQVVSMHACQDDLKFFLSVLKPQYYLPVRGSYVEMMANAKLAISMGIGLNHMNIFIMDNGMQLVFDKSPRPSIIPNEVNGININEVLVDGKGITKVGQEIIEERKRLSCDGVVIVAATVSLSKKAIISGPDCQMRGFVYVKEAEPLLKTISNFFVEEVNNALKQGVTDFEPIKLIIKDKSKRFIKRENGREPLVLPIIFVLD